MHGKVREGWFVVSASIPKVVVAKIYELGKKMMHQSRFDTIRMIFASFFKMKIDDP